MYNKFEGFFIGGVILVIIFLAFMYANSGNSYEITVTEKVVKHSNESSNYLIFAELENGEVRVFKNSDSFIVGKFDSSNMYAKIKIGQKYKIKTLGWRIPFLSAYENIVELE